MSLGKSQSGEELSSGHGGILAVLCCCLQIQLTVADVSISDIGDQVFRDKRLIGLSLCLTKKEKKRYFIDISSNDIDGNGVFVLAGLEGMTVLVDIGNMFG